LAVSPPAAPTASTKLVAYCETAWLFSLRALAIAWQ
jgi:hypothetical protein